MNMSMAVRCQRRKTTWPTLAGFWLSMMMSWPKTAKTAGEEEEMVEAKGKVRARYIRIVMPGQQDRGLRVGEVEVMQGGYNIAKEGKPSLSAPKTGSEGKFAIDGKTKNKPHAGTEPGNGPWFELDMKKVITIDSIVVWPPYIGADPKKLTPSKALKDQEWPGLERRV